MRLRPAKGEGLYGSAERISSFQEFQESSESRISSGLVVSTDGQGELPSSPGLGVPMRVGQSDRGLRQLRVETVSSTTRLEPLSAPGRPIRNESAGRAPSSLAANEQFGKQQIFDDV